MFAALPVLKPISLITNWSFLLAEKNNFKNPPISYPVSFCHNQLQQLIFLFKSPVLQSSVIVPNLYKLLVSRFSTNCFFSPSTNYPTLLQPSLHTQQSYVLLDLSKNYSFNSSLFTQYHARISMYFTYMEKWVYLSQDSCLFSSQGHNTHTHTSAWIYTHTLNLSVSEYRQVLHNLWTLQ